MQVLTSHSDHETNLDVVVGASNVESAVRSVQLLNLATLILQLFKVDFLDVYDGNVVFNQFLKEDG